MILYTEHSRAELLNKVWVWLQFSHLFLSMVIVCAHARVFQHSPESRTSAPPTQNAIANSSQPLPGIRPGENLKQTCQTEKPLTGRDTTKAPSKQKHNSVCACYCMNLPAPARISGHHRDLPLHYLALAAFWNLGVSLHDPFIPASLMPDKPTTSLARC